MHRLTGHSKNEPSPPAVGVIIPFFQSRAGLLQAAVRSAFAQAGADISVIVVDDGSPLRARAELRDLPAHLTASVTVIEQQNAGPGAARNRGLAALPNQVQAVAFLDSDDTWVPGHIEAALTALHAGADFYFTDYLQLGQSATTFELCGLEVEKSDPALGAEGLYFYNGDLFGALLKRSPVGTPTVVCRRSVLEGIQFPTDFFFGEDVFFWMQIVRRGARIAFSTEPGVLCGQGDNVAARLEWASPSYLRRTFHDYVFHAAIAKTFPLTPAQQEWNGKWMQEVTASFASAFLHRLRRRQKIDWSTVARFIAMNPSLLCHIGLMPLRHARTANRSAIGAESSEDKASPAPEHPSSQAPQGELR